MGLGDEIMTLGRAEKLFMETGKPVAICRIGGYPREHEAWIGNPAVDGRSDQKIIDGGGARPYILGWGGGRKVTFNLEHRARAGRIYLSDAEIESCTIQGDFAIVSPDLKDTASVNKGFGADRWAEVIRGFPMPVYQLVPTAGHPVIDGARKYVTPHFRNAAAVIEQARIVLTNEGGAHHMAASVKTPAVVFFGAFIPPQVTGYDFHCNIGLEQAAADYCGAWDKCAHCEAAKKTITPAHVRKLTDIYLAGIYGQNKSFHWV